MQDSMVNKPDLYKSTVLQILNFYLNNSEVILHKIIKYEFELFA